ncbi:Ribosome biogenesis protein BMS1-like [Mizuhopecten yessoensis]|uniref:Ribosome biogenesis protein BMS1-like n=1 Tax=Mizuhopecten yessoensis TaxID=6573 RepID=A0A210QM62_MIZYE|nr:Ribosome biogenesis protein BMS1-like [Mizuhopecten yessoensis]
MEDQKQSVKKHHQPRSGPSADKKKAKNKHVQELTAQQRNPKAFSIQHAIKTTRLVQRSQDIKTKKTHIPLVDRTPVEPPPVVVGIVGPPKVGKTTLLQCLVKNYAKQRLTNVEGPVTVVAGKNKRLTLLECKNDINSMIDIAKVADLVLLLVDASFGFEMETFEFLNICQVHGFPRIMGVLTHLDAFKDNKRMRKTKKRLKHRFWTEVYQGAKLFYLSGMVNEEYQKTEVHNLCRFISVMKFRPLQWRTTHPYILEDITDPETVRRNGKCDRTISMYGYVRGPHMKNRCSVHIPGCGDFTVHDMQTLPDPCPTPDQEKKRSLNQRERIIYAPMSGVGGIVYDKDAVYIDLGGSHSHTKQQETELEPANDLVSTLMSTFNPLDQKMNTCQMAVFSNTTPISEVEMQEDLRSEDQIQQEGERVRRKAIFTDGLDDVEDEPKKKRVKMDPREELVFADSDDDDDEDDVIDDKNKLLRSGYSPSSEKLRRTETGKDDGDDDDDDDDDDDSEESGNSEGEEEDLKTDEDELETDEDEVSSAKQSSQNVLDDKTNNASDDEDSDNEIVFANKNTSSSHSFNEDETLEDERDISDDDSTDDDETDDESDDEESEEDMDISTVDSMKSPKEKIVKSKSDTLLTSKIMKNSCKSPNVPKSPETSDNESDIESDEGLGDEADDKDSDEDAESDEDFKETEDGEEEERESEEEEGHLKWKSNLAEFAAESFRKRQKERVNYRKLIYGQGEQVGEAEDNNDEDDELGGLFKVLNKKQEKKNDERLSINKTDCSRFFVQHMQDWDLEEVRDLIKDCFVTGKWDRSEDAAARLEQDDELYGDFEDLETGKVHKEGDKEEKDDEGDSAAEEDEEGERKKTKAETSAHEKRVDRKKKLKEVFDKQYDMKDDSEFYDSWKQENELQAQLNRAEFENMDDDVRVGYEGFRPGMYVRVEVNNMPCEFVTNFDPSYPVILGALLNVESNVGYLQTRLKKHRWHKKILKTRNPLIVSLGWRRFQTLPLYAIQDHNYRNRLLKYTPEHLHCHSVFWGPLTPQGTGFLAIESVSDVSPGFRIAATGVVLEMDKKLDIVKKLKLTGTPQKIYKKTAFIQGMFNSGLEVTKFEGAKIKTVSGIRGQVKKAVRTPEGAFRATFEDKILLSDIVFLRTWYPVEVPQFYNPVTSLLLPHEQKTAWIGMKTVGQLRWERGRTLTQNKDSLYKPMERKMYHQRPLTIPRALQKNLPFKDTPKILRAKKDPVKRVVVIREPKETKVAKLMNMMKTLHDHKKKMDRSSMRQRVSNHQKKQALIDSKKQQKQKETKREIYKALGQIEKKENKFRK